MKKKKRINIETYITSQKYINPQKFDPTLPGGREAHI